MKSKMKQFQGKFRRLWFTLFRRAEVEKRIKETRKGECHRCGLCCELAFRCPFLGKDATNLPYCRIYGELRPESCRTYPFDELDSEIEECGFRFR